MKLSLVFILLSFIGFAQVPDSIRLLPPVDIIRPHRVLEVVYAPVRWQFNLSTQLIEELNSNDAGELIQRLPGVNMRSYGALGGMKTYSFRGLSSQDNAIIIDGFEQNNTQSGQINLAQLESDNIIGVGRVEAETNYALHPIAALLKGNAISMSTFNNVTTNDSLQIRANLKYGSFDHKDVYFAMKRTRNLNHWSVFGKFRDAKGNYPFELQNGLSSYSGLRDNNAYRDANAGVLFSKCYIMGQRLRVSYSYRFLDQELPGAVILYNSTADERMNSDDHMIQADYTGVFSSNNRYRIYSSVNRNQLVYEDPNYLSSTEGLRNAYINHSVNMGFVSYSRVLSSYKLNYGGESRYSSLRSEGVDVGHPERFESRALFGVGRDHHWFSWMMNFGGAHYVDLNIERKQKDHVLAFLPTLFLSTKELPRYRVKHSLQIQHSLRMPSFNELYYNQIDGFQLDPERADQFAYSLSAHPIRKKWNVFVIGSGFFNLVSDKIVAIPTKNLMVWSIQNIGKARVFGSEASLKVVPSLLNDWKAEFNTAYTYLRSIDVTDVHSPTYGHQIAYTPEHMLNTDLSLSRRSFGGRISSSYVSQRYALNENIAMNAVEEFFTFDLIFWYRYEFRNEQSLTLQFNVKNVGDQSYAYIRSFVMPGRNYLITLRYALH